MAQQITINGVEFAQRSEFLAGELPAEEFDRLRDVLLPGGGSIRYVLNGSLGSRGEPLLRLQLNGCIPVECQRCLERLEYPVDVDTVFELLESDGEPTQEELEDDSRDYLPAKDVMDVLALIEDELILALPVAPAHDDCRLPLSQEETRDKSPFGALAALRHKLH